MQEILVVDDDCDNLSLIRQILEMSDITVVCAANAEDALLNLTGKTFHLMITDRNMPGLDGFALALKASVLAPLMPIIMMTGDISPEVPRLAKESGISTVLGKPFRPERILEAIRAAIGEKQTAQASNFLIHR